MTAALQKRGSQYGDGEKISGTKESTKKMSRLLVIGGPAEGQMIEDNGPVLRYTELQPMTFEMWDSDEPPRMIDYIDHTYRKEQLAFKDDTGYPYTKWIYLHSSLNHVNGMERVKDFLLRQFMMMEL